MKKTLLTIIPSGWLQWYRNFRRRFSAFKNRPPKEVFTQIYHSNRWGSAESVSGFGSEVKNTASLAKALPECFRELGIRTLLDLPCGDFNWMSRVDLDGVDYLGADIVEALIQRNQQTYTGRHGVRFEVLDLLTDALPKADLVLVRDCLVHFSNQDIRKALQNIRRSDCTYLLTTTFAQLPRNRDIITGEWRPINLCKPPFLLPAPLLLLPEQSEGLQHQQKSLGLWRIADI
jgi:hypothetical protein